MRMVVWQLCFTVLLAGLPGALSARTDSDLAPLTLERARLLYPGATALKPVQPGSRVYRLQDGSGDSTVIFQTGDFSRIPAYSGVPINLLVSLTADGTYARIGILDHEEPILVIGVDDSDLQRFIDQFVNLPVDSRIRVGGHGREGYVGFDGITSATITAMIIARTVTAATREALAVAGPGAPGAAVDPAPEPGAIDGGWRWVWEERLPVVLVLTVALGLLLLTLVFQDWLVRHQRLFNGYRLGFLVFTVVGIGWLWQGQLSVLNLFAFLRNMASGFNWDSLLLDPVLFLLWGFVAFSIILWGRGVYCGWLCPFGALQELLGKLSRWLGWQDIKFPQLVHERLWALKYFILVVLTGVALGSMSDAARLAEVEPFKTVFVMHFQRSPLLVAWAVVLLLAALINNKFYCKYLCPLGAALSFVTRFRVFDWLRRRVECGHPCQICANDCQIAAIRPTGEIIDNECHYCLDCQVTYWDSQRCPPLVRRRRRGERSVTPAGDIPVVMEE